MTSPSKTEILDAVLAAYDSITELHGFTLSNGEFLSHELLRRAETELTIAELVAKGRLIRTAWHRNGMPVYVTPENFVPGMHDVFRDMSFEIEPGSRG